MAERQDSEDSVRVRPATAADRPEWFRLRSALWPHAVQEHARDIDLYLTDLEGRNAGRGLVAQHPSGRGLCGFLEIRLRDYADGCASSPVGYVEGWYVDAEFRRAGVGAALMRAAEAWARALGLSELASDTELENGLGVSAHRALDFAEVGRIVQFRKPL